MTLQTSGSISLDDIESEFGGGSSNNYLRPTTTTEVASVLGVSNIGSNANRDVTISTSAPSGGSDGDIWYTYTA
jgi:hypothetical protein